MITENIISKDLKEQSMIRSAEFEKQRAKRNDDMVYKYFNALKRLMMVELGELEYEEILDDLVILRGIKHKLPGSILKRKYNIIL